MSSLEKSSIEKATNKKSALMDADEVRRTQSLLFASGQVTEVRILKGIVGSKSYPTTLSGYFDNPESLVAALQTVKSADGIYVIPNVVDPALLSRAVNRLRTADKTTGDSDIKSRKWLLVDCDPKRPSGISATEEEHNAAIQRARDIVEYLRAAGWPEPIIADSGNGAHLLYRIDLPTNDNGLVKRCLEALSARFGDEKVSIDTSVHNPARIWKLYGTRACKGDRTADRPHRMSRILSDPASIDVVHRILLEALAALNPVESALPISQKGQGFDLDAFIARHELDVDDPKPWKNGGRIFTFRNSPMCEHHGDGPHIEQFASGAISAGCHHDSCSWKWRDLRAKFEPNAFKVELGESLCSAVIECIADVEPQPIEWLWPARIAIGKVTLLYGDPGLGKSLVTLDITARVSRGKPWPDIKDVAQPTGSVVMLSAEDDVADTIRPRLDAHDANCRKVHVIKAVKYQQRNGEKTRGFDLSQDLCVLREEIDKRKDCRLVVIDPISAYLGNADSHDNADVRAILSPLADLAAEKRVAILAVTHMRKGDGSAQHRAIGSVAFIAAARAAWVVTKDKDYPRRRLMLPSKNNLADDNFTTGLAYTIENSENGPVVTWNDDPVTITADEAMAPDQKQLGRPPEDRLRAEAFLLKALANGPRLTTEVEDEASVAECIAKRTLDRARTSLKIVCYQQRIPGPWYLRLPDQSAESSSA